MTTSSDGLAKMYKELPGNVSLGSYDSDVTDKQSLAERILMSPFTFCLRLFD